MDGNDTYGPTPLKLEAFDSIASFTGTITDITEKNFDNGPRWVITVDDDWTLIVNDTNYRNVKKTYGTKSEDWLHKPITAFKGKLHGRNGEERDGICLRVPEEAANAELAQLGDKLKDDIPF